MPKGSNFDDFLMEQLREPGFAAAYIEAAMEDFDVEYFNEVIKDVVKAYGVSHVAEQTGIARQAIYQMISSEGNPTLKSITAILDTLGLTLSVKAKKIK